MDRGKSMFSSSKRQSSNWRIAMGSFNKSGGRDGGVEARKGFNFQQAANHAMLAKREQRQSAENLYTPENAHQELIEAAKIGDCHRLGMALSGGAVDVNFVSPNTNGGSYPPLHFAALRGHKVVAEKLIQSGAEVNLQAEFGQTALHLACYNGHAEVAEVLIKNGADMELRNKAGWTPIFWACTNRKSEALVVLLLAGANINAATDEGWTPLHKASEHGFSCMVKALLRAGADDEAKTMHGDCPLDVGLSRGHNELVPIFESVRKRRERRERAEALHADKSFANKMLLGLWKQSRQVVDGVSKRIYEDRAALKCNMKVPCKPENQRALRDAADVVAARSRALQRLGSKPSSSDEDSSRTTSPHEGSVTTTASS